MWCLGTVSFEGRVLVDRGTGNLQTSVRSAPMITCFLPVALRALRNSGLSKAFTSPVRRMKGASRCISRISLSIGPLGPVSAVVVRIAGMRNRVAREACPRRFGFSL
jgi:hypothetical protein